MKINANYFNLEQSYLFTNINRKVAAYQAKHPDRKIIRLGIGDVTRFRNGRSRHLPGLRPGAGL